MNIVQKTILSLAKKSGFIPLTSSRGFFNLKGIGQGFGFNLEDDDRLINEGFASNTNVYAIIQLINNAASRIPFVLYEKTADGLEEVVEGDFYDLLQNPNTKQTQKEFREEALGYLLNTGDRFYLGTESFGMGNAIKELVVLPSNITNILVSTSNEVVGYQVTIGGKIKTYDTEEVWHGKYFNPTIEGLNSHRGLSPLQAGYRTLTASNELITAEASIYKNKGVAGILSSADAGLTLTEDEAQAVQKNIIGKMGGAEKAGGVTTTTGIVKYTPIGMPPSDMEMFKSGGEKLQSLCRLYGFDSNLLGDPKASSWNNVTESNKKFYTNAVIPNNEALVSDLNRFLVPNWSKRDKKEYIIKQDTSGIEALQSNQKEEADKNKVVADTIVGVLAAPISDSAKRNTLLKTLDIELDEIDGLVPVEDDKGTGTSENTGGNVQVQSLNGAQVTSMVAIVQGVGDGSIPKPSAISILVVSYGMTPEAAGRIINPIQVNQQSDGE